MPEVTPEELQEAIELPGLDLFGFPTERFLTNKQIDEVTSPRALAERIPGFAEKMDGVKEIRGAYQSEVTKLTKRSYEGWSHIGSLPMEVFTTLSQLYTPEELMADGGRVIKQWIARNPEYRVSNENL